MFGISSTEFLIILVIALVVIGPQKLPEMIRTVGKWVGKIQHFTRNVKNDLTNEFELDEIRKSLEELKQSSELQKLKSELDSTKSQVTSSMRSFESSMTDTKSGIESEAKKLDAYLEMHDDAKVANHKPLQGNLKTPEKATASGAVIDDEEAFDIAFEDAFLKSEAEIVGDSNHDPAADYELMHDPDVMSAPPKGFADKVIVQQDDQNEIIARIVRQRQAEIAAETDPKVATQFALLEAKRSRHLLSEAELRRRMTLRQLEMNR